MMSMGLVVWFVEFRFGVPARLGATPGGRHGLDRGACLE